MDVKVSVVMPTYNRAFILKLVLDSLMDQTYKNYEIVLVDDGSGDSTLEMLKKYPADKLKVICQENQGPAGARNTGIRNASGDIILFIDSDVICPRDLIETHVKNHQESEWLIVQGQLVRIIDLDQAFKAPFNMWHYSRSFFDTANVSVRKKHLEKAGGFDAKSFKKGWEDLDIGLRLLKSGLKAKRLVKEAYVWHYEGNFSHENVLDFFEDRYREGQAALSFYRKYPTFSVKMMVMEGRLFYWLADRLFKEKYLKSPEFYKKIKNLLDAGKVDKAIALVRYNGYCFHFKGMRDKIKQDGYVLRKNNSPIPL
jgi:glycosyltransferase involved in cell wall biosynthesis